MRQHAQHAFRRHAAIGIGKIPLARLPVGKAGADPLGIEGGAALGLSGTDFHRMAAKARFAMPGDAGAHGIRRVASD